jgi:CheY-like chemotaxis protein
MNLSYQVYTPLRCRRLFTPTADMRRAVRLMSHAPVILFVDGNLADREYYSQHFRITFPNCKIVHAATGKSGLAFCERKPVGCIVVLEIDLPDMSGFEVLPKVDSTRSTA